MSATSEADNRDVTRRHALVAGAGVVACGLNGFSGQAADNQRVDPFHDPIYDAIPQRAELVKHLTKEAVEGQQKVRRLNGLAVTGLPQALPDLDEQVTRLLKRAVFPEPPLPSRRRDA
jgi:hypothetical protein